MKGVDLIQKYFSGLTHDQLSRFELLESLYKDWNSRINVISRNDIDHFYERHVLHSLAIARKVSFGKDVSVLDAGTGGGFPGIPLAIMFPHTRFILADSIRKKILVVNEVIAALELRNAEGVWTRTEEMTTTYDFVVSRAVTAMDKFIPLVKERVTKGNSAGYKHGIFYLRGDIDEALLKKYAGHQVDELSNWFEEPFFESKKLVYLPL